MTTRTPTGRLIEVPDLVGYKAERAIQKLRELGLMPVAWSADVDDVNEAGFVLGLDPPAGASVRPKASITMSVAAHPDFRGHSDEPLAAESEQSTVQPPLTWPLSSPTGFAAEPTARSSDPLIESFAPSATPDAPSTPASLPTDAASWETRYPDAEDSSAIEPTPGVAADPYLEDLSLPVPTPIEISDDDQWDRLRAAEAARHAAGAPVAEDVQEEPCVPDPPAVDSTEALPTTDRADELEDHARREASRRRARRRRLTFKQKVLVGAIVAFTLLIAVAAMSAHKPSVTSATTAHVAHRKSPRRHTGAAPAPSRDRGKSRKRTPTRTHHKRTKHTAPARRRHARRRRRISHSRRPVQTHVTTVTVQAPAPSTPATNNSSPVAPASTPPSSTAAPNPGAGSPTTSSPPVSAPPAPTTASHQSSAHSSGSSSQTPLQSPDGTTAPPQP